MAQQRQAIRRHKRLKRACSGPNEAKRSEVRISRKDEAAEAASQTKNGRGDRIRTRGPRFWRPMLYQLSYTPALAEAAP